MITPSRRALTTASATLLALALFGCSSGSDTTPDDTGSVDGAEEPTDPQDSTDPDDRTGTTSDQVLYAVGDTFALANVGDFEATYLGLADLGMADGGSVGEVHCYAVLAELSLAAEPELGGSGWIPGNESVFDADGAAIGTHVTAGCPVTPLIENGYTPAESLVWVEGVAQNATLVTAAVPVGSEDAMAEVELSNRDGFRLAAEVTETF